MCGIAGVIGFKDKSAARDRVATMLHVLERRGPDDEGIESWNSAVLGHRRLSVFDLSSAGHQPMMVDDGNICIVFNGAIYNFRALRAELETRGCKFNSQTDTEVLLHGYREWGIDKLAAKIQGMFAFGLWDDLERSLYLVRDRLGVKPLIYALNNGEIAFASNVRALKRAGFGGDLDPRGVAEYLEFGFVTDEFSIYKGIEKLPPATILKWSNGEVSTHEYWRLPNEFDETITFDEAVDETERLFLQAVEKRLQADVPVGALLSGGIDSSLVCWGTAKLGGDVTAFTVGVPNDEWDESSVAVRTAKQLGIKHKVMQMSGQVSGDGPVDVGNLTKAFGEPFASASALGLIDISREVSRDATVLLTGDGGDDVFLGYPEHLHFRIAEKLARATPKALASVLQTSTSVLPKRGALKRANSFLNYSFGGLGAVTQARDGLPVYEQNRLLGDRMRGISISHREIALSSGENLLAEFLQYDRRTRFVGEYLPKVDGATMFHAVEARSPFLDTELWEFAARLPFSIRLRGRSLKAVLREIVRRRIGPELAAAKKQGFGVPVQRWLTREWKNSYVETMRNSLLGKEGWIDSGRAINLLLASEKSGWAPRQAWFILVFENWLRYERGETD
ncbi:MAG: asparagine synthase (glutamine-hydrolyzing) [Pyrinomonadaceae bacterium]